jgi:uncharacterized membrane protein
VTSQVIGQRFSAFDRLRGLIMALMAIDHASFAIARVHAYEAWSTSPIEPATITRAISHLCAPGFFMLMGAAMVWLGKARQKVDGWSHARIRKFFITRGLLLLLIQHVIENPAWMLQSISASPSAPMMNAVQPGGGGDFYLHFAVISALGAAMIFWGLLIELPSIIILAICGAAMVLTAWMMPPAREIATLWPFWKLLLFVPSHNGPVNVLYPFVPWLVPAGVGIVLGRIVYKKPSKTALIGFGAGLAMLVAYFLIDQTQFNVFLKYPPTASFLTVTLGVNLLLIGVFALVPQARLGFLDVLGRSPFFFYLLHLYVLAVISFAFPNGSSLPVMYAVWFVVMLVTYPLVAAFGRFKATRSVESTWRMF